MSILGLTLILIALAGAMWLIFGRKARAKREIASDAAARAVRRRFESGEDRPDQDEADRTSR